MKNLKATLAIIFVSYSLNAQTQSFTSKSGAQVTITYGDFSHGKGANGPQDDFYASVADSQAQAEAEEAYQKKLAVEAANNLVYKLDPKSGDPYTCDRRNSACYHYLNKGVDSVTVAPNQIAWPQSLGILEGYFKHVVNKHKTFLADADLQAASLIIMRDYTLPMMEILSLVKSEKGKAIPNVKISSAFLNGELGFNMKPAAIKTAQAKYKSLVSKMNWDMNHQFLVTDAVAVVVLVAEEIQNREGGPLTGMNAIGPSRNDVAALAAQIRKTRDAKWIKYVETVLAPFMASVAKAGLTRDGTGREIFPDYRFDTFKALTYKSFSNLTYIQKASTQFFTLKLTKK